ncbi:MAG: NADH-quinone oxidoreductase subunit J [Proteobacteria bacterium]|nr:MAG: NADH-quinone oxidoreductase subunit J [Pseudomonadota bacterium]
MDAVTGLLMALAVAGALLAVSLRNILHAIFGLALSLLAIAGLFLVLNSPFVAAMEVLIYVGGISVAMVFAVMLSTVVPKDRQETRWRRGGAALVALTFLLGVGAAIIQTDLSAATGPAVADPAAWGVDRVGHALLDHYNLVFEALSVVLLLAIIGAIVISRRDRAEDPPTEEAN